jgi:hypothetical protein
VIGKGVAVLVLVVGLVCWAIGGWQVYESNTFAGAVSVLVGGILVVGVIAWWRRDPDAGFEAVLRGVIEFVSRA